MTKRLIVTFDDETYEALRRLAFERKTQMAKLVRSAVGRTFEDDLDGMIGDMRLKEHLQDPSGSVTIEDMMKELGIELPGRTGSRGKERARRAAG